ncbi:unnamed protein product, partial [Musa acuminata subsp. malaccensis]
SETPERRPGTVVHMAVILRHFRRLRCRHRRVEFVHELVHRHREFPTSCRQILLLRRVQERPVERHPAPDSEPVRGLLRGLRRQRGTRGLGWVAGGVARRGGLDLLVSEWPCASDPGRGRVGAVELGAAAAEVDEGGVEGPRGLLGRVVGAEPDSLAAVGEPDLGHPPPPLPPPHPLVPPLPRSAAVALHHLCHGTTLR